MAQLAPTSTRYRLAFGVGAIVGVLGGLIGLGGAEFRLPLLVGWFRYPLLPAILVNLLVSFVTVVVSLAFRLQSQGLAPLLEQWPVAINILAGSLPGSYVGVYLATRISERTLVATVAVVLTLLGLVLIGHDWFFARDPIVLAPVVRMAVGFLAGLLIGAVSSLLGVAGGELIIPTLALFFAMDIKLAGSVSLMISSPTIIVGILRYQRTPVFRGMKRERNFVLVMSLGSVLGAWVGSQLLPHVPSGLLQIFLGLILVFSAAKMARTRLFVRNR